MIYGKQRRQMRRLFFALAVIYVVAMTLYLADGKWLFAITNLGASVASGWVGWIFGKEDKARERKR